MEAKELTKQLFETKKIKSVIYVDDEFSLDSYKDNLFGYIHSKYDKGVKFPFLNIDENFPIEIAFNNWWDKSDDKSKKEKILEYGIQPTKTEIATKLYDLLPEDTLKCLSPDIFLSSTKEIIENVNENNQVLVLMDQDLKSGKRDGDSLLLNLENEECFSCGIFSSTFYKEKEIEEWENRDYKKNVYPLSKHRFEDDEDSIIEGLRNVLWLKQISEIKNKTTLLIKNSTEYAIDELRKMDPASFNHAVVERSKDEGCWEFQTLQRILMILLNKGVHDEMKDNYFDNFQTQTKTLRSLNNVATTSIMNTELLKSLRRSEQLIEGEYINRIFSPIENGDIFEIGGKKYILICQPCSISIREKGKRSYGLNHAYLLPIYHQEDNYEVKKDNEAEIIIASGEKYIVRFNKSEVVCLSVMDLVSYNIDGIARINIEEKNGPEIGKDIMQINMIQRYVDIIKSFEKYTKTISAIKNIEKESKRCVEKILNLHFKWTPKIVGNNIVQFDIKRISRYNEFYSQILLQKFMSYLSRPGFPNDISEIKK